MVIMYMMRACFVLQSGRVAATPRQLEAMIRISEALARMHLRTEVSASLRPDAHSAAHTITSAIIPTWDPSNRHWVSCIMY
jgi:DNA replicative helicase MCM subunit Mcm2 (Cdc46/Mcm family)